MRTPSRPLLGQGQAVAADDLEAGALRVTGADLEAGGENQTVQRVFDAVDDHAVHGDLLDSPAVGVDEGDVGTVERLQVLVVEAGPLAEVAVPRLERLGGGRIGHDRIDARPDLFHLGEVGQFGGVRPCVVHDRQLFDEAGPRVVDQVLVGRTTRGEDLEVLHAPLLPTGLQRAAHSGSVGRLARTSTVDGVR